MKIILQYKASIITALIGAIGGFLYWYFVGCVSGTCPIQSYWYTSSLYGALIGFFIGGMIKDNSKKKGTENGDI